MSACKDQHEFVSNSGAGGDPKFKILYGSRVNHVRCRFCNCRTWLTPAEWRDRNTSKDPIL